MSNTTSTSTTQENNQNSRNMKDCLYVPDELGLGEYAHSKFNAPKYYEYYIGNVLIPVGLIKDTSEKLAGDIFEDLNSQHGFFEIYAVYILKEGYMFFSDLLDNLNALNTTSGRSIPLSIDFIEVCLFINCENSLEHETNM